MTYRKKDKRYRKKIKISNHTTLMFVKPWTKEKDSEEQ